MAVKDLLAESNSKQRTERDLKFRTEAEFHIKLLSYDQTPVKALERRFVVATDLVTTMSMMVVGRRMVIETFRQAEDDGVLAEYTRGQGMVLSDALLKHSVAVLLHVVTHELGHAFHGVILKSGWQHVKLKLS
ncbi:unnamed protein product [Bursaphelenchus okinawaensis]|uniref:Uncharacterized protein n=1 Tax=Bursaphelenchus okinawaensis TaxID=465554 RepID=A0A811LJ65_9BILA|nr:unnamed protein product [Bursaphelenchus okinawaensis]CAG9124203.1 unnamed protein product [Bursaphelenchus okinawaensis]